MGSRYYVPKNNAFGDICDTIRNIRATMAAMENIQTRHASLPNSEASLYRKLPTVNSDETMGPGNVVRLRRSRPVVGPLRPAPAELPHHLDNEGAGLLVQLREDGDEFDSARIMLELMERLGVDIETLMQLER